MALLHGAQYAHKGTRIGEAGNPGPYSEGGATSSGRGAWQLDLRETAAVSKAAGSEENSLGRLQETENEDVGWIMTGREAEGATIGKRQGESRARLEGMGKQGISEELRRKIEVNKLEAIGRKKAREKQRKEEEEKHHVSGARIEGSHMGNEARRKGASCFDEEYQDPSGPWEEEEEVAEPPVWEWPLGEEESLWAHVATCKDKEGPAEFILAKEFVGMRNGMVFKKGPAGLGYYDDPGGRAAEGNEEKVGQAVKLSLTVLIQTPEEAREQQRKVPRRRRPPGRRRKPRKRKAGWESKDEDATSATGSPRAGSSTSSSVSQATSEEDDVDMESVATEGSGSYGRLSETADDEEATDSESTPEELEIDEEELSEGEQEEAGGSRDWWLFDTVNANSWGGEAEVAKGKGALVFLQRTVADAAMMQETRLVEAGRREAAYRAARRAKWNLLALEAATTEKG